MWQPEVSELGCKTTLVGPGWGLFTCLGCTNNLEKHYSHLVVALFQSRKFWMAVCWLRMMTVCWWVSVVRVMRRPLLDQLQNHLGSVFGVFSGVYAKRIYEYIIWEVWISKFKEGGGGTEIKSSPGLYTAALCQHDFLSFPDIDYLFGHYSGIVFVSTFYFVVYAAFRRNKPMVYPRLILPGLISGIMWGIAMCKWWLIIQLSLVPRPLSLPG